MFILYKEGDGFPFGIRVIPNTVSGEPDDRGVTR